MIISEREGTGSATLKRQLTHPEKDLILQFRNFPTFPSQHELKCQTQNINKVLAERFPWGCSKLREDSLNLNPQDQVFENWLPSYFNICLSIKYGVCPFMKKSSLDFFERKLQQVKNRRGELYMKIQDSRHVYSLAKVLQINRESVFRFWNSPPGSQYPIGVASLEIVAIGHVEVQQLSKQADIHFIFSRLRQGETISHSQWRAADDMQWRERMRWIIQIQNGNLEKEEKRFKALIKEQTKT